MKSVAAIILNWNRLDDTAACCQSLMNQDVADLDIWVVDNGSSENNLEELSAACPGARVMRLDRNLGFAGGVNAGIRAAQEFHPYDYYWLVNNDTRCEPSALTALLTVMIDPGVAAAGCEMLEGPSHKSPRRVAPGKRLRPPFYVPMEAGTSAEIDYLCGACLLLRREALDQVGLLDERFFFFFEDADWSFRAKKMGWKLGTAGGDWVRHAGSGTIGRMTFERSAYYREGHIRFARKHCRFPRLVVTGPMVWRLLFDFIQGNRESIRGALEGWHKGWAQSIET